MIYTGAPRRSFQLPVAHEIEPKPCTRRLWLLLCGPCVISEHVEMEMNSYRDLIDRFHEIFDLINLLLK